MSPQQGSGSQQGSVELPENCHCAPLFTSSSETFRQSDSPEVGVRNPGKPPKPPTDCACPAYSRMRGGDQAVTALGQGSASCVSLR